MPGKNPLSCMPDFPERRCWTREEYERAALLGLFGPEERLELIEGEIVTKMTQNSLHTTSMNLAAAVLHSAFATGFYIRLQAPLSLGDHSQPEPDIAIVTGTIRDYTQQHPTTAVLAVEISDSTLTYDRTTKAALYARAGIAEYWIINLNDRVLEVHRLPAPMADQLFGHHYRSITRHTETETVAPLAAPTLPISVTDLLP